MKTKLEPVSPTKVKDEQNEGFLKIIKNGFLLLILLIIGRIILEILFNI